MKKLDITSVISGRRELIFSTNPVAHKKLLEWMIIQPFSHFLSGHGEIANKQKIQENIAFIEDIYAV
ncbi:MAG: hypothetical protein ACTSYI_00250 [Promethearchaeota archaeon]